MTVKRRVRTDAGDHKCVATDEGLECTGYYRWTPDPFFTSETDPRFGWFCPGLIAVSEEPF